MQRAFATCISLKLDNSNEMVSTGRREIRRAAAG
jgi:hypothetical protein